MAVRNTVNAVEVFFISSVVLEADEYQSINSQGLPFPCFLIRVINNSNKDVMISYDGVTDHDFIPMGQTLQLPFQSNSQPNGYVALMAKGTIVYVQGAAGTGDIYLAAYYQKSVV